MAVTTAVLSRGTTPRTPDVRVGRPDRKDRDHIRPAHTNEELRGYSAHCTFLVTVSDGQSADEVAPVSVSARPSACGAAAAAARPASAPGPTPCLAGRPWCQRPHAERP